MPWHNALIAVICYLLFLAAGICEGSQQPRKAPGTVDTVSGASLTIFQRRPLKIGIITLSETPQTMKAIDKTIDAVRKSFAPYPIEVTKRLPTKELEEQIRKGSIDAFVASSGFFWRMQQYGAISVGTLITDMQPDPNQGVAAAILVRKDSPYEKISDLKGTRLSASYPTAFMSYRTAMAEIASRGEDPEHFFSSIHYLGDTFNSLIAARLINKASDVAMVRACWLETQPPEIRNLFRVVEPRQADNLLCIHSTRTYPNIMVAVTQGSAPGAAHLISKTLLTMPKMSTGHHWGLATDMRSVDRLYRELMIENYAYLRETTIERWVAKNYLAIIFAVACVLLLAAHSWRVGYLVKRRTSELMRLLTSYRESEERFEKLHRRMERMQKAAVVGQLSNLIAHELSQPIAAIRYYCDGLRELIKSKTPDPALLATSVSGMQTALERTGSIVEKVRSYSKSEVRRDSSVSVLSACNAVISGITPALRERADFQCAIAPDLHVRADRLELELLLNNLLKNAFEAAADSADRFVCISAKREEKNIAVTVENSGPAISGEAFAELRTPLITSKKAGHGLGIPIAIALAEASGGHLTFYQRAGGGLTVTLTLVAADSNVLTQAVKNSNSTNHSDA